MERKQQTFWFHFIDNDRILILEREIALLADPVEKLQLRLQLARFYESKNQVEQARVLMENVYSENPLLLGVVRSTVDFYWRNEIVGPRHRHLGESRQSGLPRSRQATQLRGGSESRRSQGIRAGS